MADSSCHLPGVVCPGCQSILAAFDAKIRTAAKYSDCLRRCERCGIGFSNGRCNPTIIYRNPERNIPDQVRSGALETLSLALNEKHRPDKLVKFGFSTSEDALTWTVFHHLNRTGQLHSALYSCGSTGAQSGPLHMLLWGVPDPLDSPDGNRLRQQLIAICDRLGEAPTRRSEPDVIVDFGDGGLAVIEVKYSSRNDSKKFGSRYNRYVLAPDTFADVAAIGRSELYELTRNWRIGVELASGRPFTLVNLVVGDTDPHRTTEFRRGLDLKVGNFLVIRWRDFITHFQHPDWLESYLSLRLPSD